MTTNLTVGLKLKDIKGCLPEFRESNEDMVGFNAIINSTGKYRITLNRENLAENIMNTVNTDYEIFSQLALDREPALKIADSIISELKNIVEVVQ